MNPTNQTSELDLESIEKTRKEFIAKIVNDREPMLSQIEGSVFHQNYLEYLKHCWAKHLSVIVDPTILWHMVLCELAVDIRTHVEDYRPFMSESKEKQSIEIDMALDGFNVDLFIDRILPELFDLIPSALDESIILPKFSTHTPLSKFTHKIAFLDAASPYYNYSMFLCNIPEVKVLGTEFDWQLFDENLAKLSEIFAPLKEVTGNTPGINGKMPGISWYFNRVRGTLARLKLALKKKDTKWLRSIFSLERCGSGGEMEIHGWINDFFKVNMSSKMENYNTHVSHMEFKVHPGQTYEQDFQLYAGLFSSDVQDDFLMPHFGFSLVEKTEETKADISQEKFNIKQEALVDDKGFSIAMAELKAEPFKVDGKVRDLK